MSRCRSSTGRLFHSRGPATAKLLSPSRVCVRGIAQVWTSGDRRCRRPISVTSWQSSDRYGLRQPSIYAHLSLSDYISECLVQSNPLFDVVVDQRPLCLSSSASCAVLCGAAVKNCNTKMKREDDLLFQCGKRSFVYALLIVTQSVVVWGGDGRVCVERWTQDISKAAAPPTTTTGWGRLVPGPLKSPPSLCNIPAAIALMHRVLGDA